MTTELILKAAQHIQNAKSLVIVTGAGVSKESGIPTYRDPRDGLWTKYNPEELATPKAFKDNPKLVWEWMQYQRDLMRDAKPNPGHFALAELERILPQVVIITQNIDGLHQQAGSTNVIELHGNQHRYKCFSNCQGDPTLVSEEDWDTSTMPPTCPYCGSWMRPDTVWFNELIPDDRFKLAKSFVDKSDVLMTVGTSGVVQPASTFPYRAKRWNDAFVIDVNPTASEITLYADLHIAAPSGEALPLIVQALRESK